MTADKSAGLTWELSKLLLLVDEDMMGLCGNGGGGGGATDLFGIDGTAGGTSAGAFCFTAAVGDAE